MLHRGRVRAGPGPQAGPRGEAGGMSGAHGETGIKQGTAAGHGIVMVVTACPKERVGCHIHASGEVLVGLE